MKYNLNLFLLHIIEAMLFCVLSLSSLMMYLSKSYESQSLYCFGIIGIIISIYLLRILFFEEFKIGDYK